jgi:hypothetical protein
VSACRARREAECRLGGSRGYGSCPRWFDRRKQRRSQGAVVEQLRLPALTTRAFFNSVLTFLCRT